MLTIIAEICTAFVSLFVSPGQADALRRTAPEYLTIDSARVHVAASWVIPMLVGKVDGEDLLSIGHHESNYKQDEIQVEPPITVGTRTYRRWSCGVMTPEPMTDLAACRENTRSLAAGYLAGAQHLRHWMDGRDSPCRVLHGADQRRCALRGYGGTAAPAFAWRARWIARELAAKHEPQPGS